ncbi:MAG: TolC family protein [Bacteroidia bacterium]
MRKAGLFLCFFLVFGPLAAQDSLQRLDARIFMRVVLDNHPMVRQSQIAVERGQAVLRQARGAFDPVIQGSWSEKVYDGVDYYNLENYGIKLPTWFGIEGFAGYDRSRGVYFNPENRTPADGQWQAGLSLPIGQGLWVDKRRTVLRQAQVVRDAAYVEQEQLINDMLLQAGRSFWQWQQMYREYIAYLQAEEISKEVLDAVRLAYQFGDRAAIDTLEATIQLQNWEQLRIDSYLKYQTAGLELETFLWDAEGRPLALSPQALPDTSGNGTGFTFSPVQQAITEALNNPAYRLIDYRRQQLRYEERWQRERLKPDVRLKFYAINEPTRLDINPFPGQRVGLDFRFPLFLRDARGSLKQVKLQQENLQLEQSQRAFILSNRLAALQLEYDQLGSLISTQLQVVENLEAMLEAEKIRFQQGESSIFIINQREAQLVSGRLRLISLQTRQQTNFLAQLHLTGELVRVPN